MREGMHNSSLIVGNLLWLNIVNDSLHREDCMGRAASSQLHTKLAAYQLGRF